MISMKWTIAKIRAANADAGGVFFDRSHTKYSTTLPKVYESERGVFFITYDHEPEQQEHFHVWQFWPETGKIGDPTAGQRTLAEAQVSAEWKAYGKSSA